MQTSITRVEDFIGNLKLDTRAEKVREFLRAYNIPSFFEGDTEEEIEETKNAWAGYAYVMMLEKLNGKELSKREEDFYNTYYYAYLLNTVPVGLEKELKSFYIKHRMTKDFQYNQVKNDDSKLQFIITIETIISEIYGEKIKIVESESIRKTTYNGKRNEVIISDIDGLFKSITSSSNFNEEMILFVSNICNAIEEYRLNEEKKFGISNKALIYTIEDYIESKTLKNTKLARLYKELYNNIIANKQIAIDSSKKAYEALLELSKKMSNAKYGSFDKYFGEFLDSRRQEHLLHYYSDAIYFDTNNLEEDAFSKLFKLYVNGLKAMPKSKLTNVTKFFVINGNALTLLDMNAIKEKYIAKASRQKDEDSKKTLEKYADQVCELIDFVKAQSISYKMEEYLMGIVSGKEDNTALIELASSNMSEFEEMGNRLLAAYASLDQLASSGYPSKVASIRRKREILSSMIFIQNSIYSEICDVIETKGIDTIDLNRDIVIEKVTNKDKVIALLQELTGRGIIELEQALNYSIESGVPIMRDLTPGYKAFVEEALKLRGASKLSSNR